ncbi:protein tyrosine phosphatase domain-containing protein 1 isoform X1 [Anguilla anguilla]|uniref:protein tyrosine phosphatase domain-containing protein 1 isoform X1 n=2 Tax=Anguilla anguilla TaxID=7936 RepID=UPI0015B1843A|nr:protein tyrosine phosphatase domain-containing protein 1 isoform X1 [Anguilla anguilla]XP_035257975.1 protein tyrosine phosphatase domain-containing protein 1 isoform X1 [Anguilla anguilla]
MTLPVPVPRPSYSQARENLVKAIPPKIICLLACGGRDCRYEGPACWRPSQQAVRGLFSTWVTDAIVAMARPSTQLIKRYSIIEQFHQLEIKSIINMQLPGEHAHCGPPLELESGFTYSPHTFMENGIFFYNFGMPDFGVSSPAGMLDAVKVLAFAVQEGRVAVHCHAGLGRTAVLIACYLIYTLRVSPSEAIHYVRIKRPRSIQTRVQIDLVFVFARLLAPQLVQYPAGAPFSLQQYLHRQRLLLHGEEARVLRSVPKIVHFLCGRLTAMAWGRVPCPAARAELERGGAVLRMTATLRDTLRARKFLPVLRDPARPRKASLSSVSSWDDPHGFLERKREVLLNKRSYSDADLCKIALSQDLDFVLTPSKEIPKYTMLESRSNDQKLAGTGLNTHRKDQCNGKVKTRGVPSTASRGMVTKNSAKRTRCMTKKNPALPKFSSNVELSRSQSSSVPALESQAVAKAMAEQDPPGEDVLLRVALLQDELNASECSWAILATELDPAVLSCLLWAWLEKLKEPVLKGEDVERITSDTQGLSSFGLLEKAQERTISCILRCVGQVTSLCPQLEGSVLWRLVRALTRCSQDDMEQYAALVQVFKAIAKGYRCHGSCPRSAGKDAQPVKKNR